MADMQGVGTFGWWITTGAPVIGDEASVGTFGWWLILEGTPATLRDGDRRAASMTSPLARGGSADISQGRGGTRTNTIDRRGTL